MSEWAIVIDRRMTSDDILRPFVSDNQFLTLVKMGRAFRLHVGSVSTDPVNEVSDLVIA